MTRTSTFSVRCVRILQSPHRLLWSFGSGSPRSDRNSSDRPPLSQRSWTLLGRCTSLRSMRLLNTTRSSRCWLAASVLALTITGCGSLKVSGAVTDATTGQPVVPCRITFDKYSSETSLTGTYRIKVPGSAPELVFRAPGYVTKSVTLSHDSDSDRYLERDVVLERDPASTSTYSRLESD